MGAYSADAAPRTDAAYLAYLKQWTTREYDVASTAWGEPVRRLPTRRAIATALQVLPLAA
jgi:hypothetical protein